MLIWPETIGSRLKNRRFALRRGVSDLLDGNTTTAPSIGDNSGICPRKGKQDENCRRSVPRKDVGE